MLSGANREKYDGLKMELSNQFDFGNDLYPKSIDQCLTMLNRRVEYMPRTPRNTPTASHDNTTHKPDNEVLVFAWGSNKKERKKPSSAAKDDSSSNKYSSASSSQPRGSRVTNICCAGKNCGKLGHTSTVCPDAKPPPPAQIHAMAETDDPSDASNEDSVIILTQFAVPEPHQGETLFA